MRHFNQLHAPAGCLTHPLRSIDGQAGSIARRVHGCHHASGFTLIELLIVVAIISILSAIAVPNFMEAQTRAKISRIKNDQRALATAIESYRVDNNQYPARRNSTADEANSHFPAMPELGIRLQQMHVMTTPIAYITSLPPDIFDTFVQPPLNVIDYWDEAQVYWFIRDRYPGRPEKWISRDAGNWMTISVGPDGYMGAWDATWGYPFNKNLSFNCYIVYDPTNGTTSAGNLLGGNLANSKKSDPMNWADH